MFPTCWMISIRPSAKRSPHRPGTTWSWPGAGSGKTRVLTHRIGWLLEVERVSPWSILAVTFTNKAAAEMRSRTQNLVGDGPRGLSIGTFHGIAHRLLRRHWREARLPETFQILDSDDQQRLIKRTIQGLGIDEARFPPRQAAWFINSAKDEGKRPEAIDAAGNPLAAHPDRYLCRLRAGLPARRAGRFRRAAAARARALAQRRGPARALPRALSASADRRVPGHQYPAIRLDPRARR